MIKMGDMLIGKGEREKIKGILLAMVEVQIIHELLPFLRSKVRAKQVK